MSQKCALDVKICMGSSCYSRGNDRNIQTIREFIAAHNADHHIAGHLCQDQCRNGPNLEINGQPFHQVSASTLVTILREKGDIPHY